MQTLAELGAYMDRLVALINCAKVLSSNRLMTWSLCFMCL